MTTSDYYINTVNYGYQWTIKNFVFQRYIPVTRLYISQRTWEISSVLSHSFPNDMFVYNLIMTVKADDVTWCLKIRPLFSSPLLKLTYRLSILKTNGKPIKTENGFILDSKNARKIIMQVTKKDLLSEEWNLFHDSKDLEIAFNLTMCDKDTATLLKISTYISKQHKSIKDNLEELLKSENDSDVIFEVDGKEFKAHKLVLMARSPVFTTMFSIDMIEKGTGRVTIVDISSSIFEILLHFIYTDQIMMKLDFETGIDLMKAASKYQLEGLEALCEAELFQLLTPTNAMDILFLAQKNHFGNFTEIISNFIKEYLKIVPFK